MEYKSLHAHREVVQPYLLLVTDIQSMVEPESVQQGVQVGLVGLVLVQQQKLQQPHLQCQHYSQ